MPTTATVPSSTFDGARTAIPGCCPPTCTRTLTSLSSDGAVEAEGGAGKPKYVPHAMTARVTRASTVNTMAEEDLEALSGDAPPALDAVVE